MHLNKEKENLVFISTFSFCYFLKYCSVSSTLHILKKKKNTGFIKNIKKQMYFIFKFFFISSWHKISSAFVVQTRTQTFFQYLTMTLTTSFTTI